MTTSHIPPLLDAIAIVGGRSALARALGVTPVAVGQWVSDGKYCRRVPPKQCVRIEALTDGRITRRQLRPDDWQDYWPDRVEHQQSHPKAPAHQARVAINSEVQGVAA